MSIRLKLVVIILFVALVPLTISALTALNLHKQAFDDSIGQIHHKTAAFGARLTQGRMDGIQQSLELVIGAIQWPTLSVAESEGAQWLVYRQLEDIILVSLLDSAGEGIGTSVYVDEATADPPGHPLASMPMLQAAARNIPFERARKEGAAWSKVFQVEGIFAPLQILAVHAKGQTPDKDRTIVVGLSLRGICRDVTQISTAGVQVLLLDDEDRIICRSDERGTLERVDPALRGSMAETDLRFTDRQGQRMVAAKVALPMGWSIVLQQAESVAFSASRRMAHQTIFWIGLSLLIALVAGLFLARSISQPVRRLARGATEFAKGNFGFRLALSSGDEFGRLSSTLNTMGEEIEKREAEIEAWNEELQQRVEHRTRELKELQDELLQSKKIAAVTSMGAGVAHEINNPLTAVLGLTQVLLDQARGEQAPETRKILTNIEREAQRIRIVVHNMQSLAEDFAGENFVRLRLDEVLNNAVDLMDWDLEKDRIQIERRYADKLPEVLGNKNKLSQAFMHVLSNSHNAMPGGGRLTLSTSIIEERLVKVSIADSGKGIAPEIIDKILDPFFTTKDNWESSGLGLTVAFRIIEEHNGKLKIDSAPEQGTAVSITVPITARGAHLR